MSRSHVSSFAATTPSASLSSSAEPAPFATQLVQFILEFLRSGTPAGQVFSKDTRVWSVGRAAADPLAAFYGQSSAVFELKPC